MNYDEILEYLKKKKLQSRINKLAKKYKDKRIIIYGAGLFFTVISENFNLSGLNIVAISDKKFKTEEEYKGLKAIPVSSINKSSFDVMIIATFEPENIEENFKKEFYSKYGKFDIVSFDNYTFKEFISEVKACFC